MYKDITDNQEIPTLTIDVTALLMVSYCGVTWDFARFHYDAHYVAERGFSKPVVDPQMHGGFIARLLTDWTSGAASLRRLTLTYRAACMLGDRLTYAARVKRKYDENSGRFVECDIQVLNQKEEPVVTGSAIICFD